MDSLRLVSFYFDKKEHYEISDEFIEHYQQKDDGSEKSYITYAKQTGHIIDATKHEPNQKWHLLESYFMRRLKKKEI